MEINLDTVYIHADNPNEYIHLYSKVEFTIDEMKCILNAIYKHADNPNEYIHLYSKVEFTDERLLCIIHL